MKYLCLVYLGEKRLTELPDSDCVAYDRAVLESVHCIASEALQSAQTATIVHAQRQALCDRRPFAKTKEQLAGFTLWKRKI